MELQRRSPAGQLALWRFRIKRDLEPRLKARAEVRAIPGLKIETWGSQFRSPPLRRGLPADLLLVEKPFAMVNVFRT
jgi:hypothetical protein